MRQLFFFITVFSCFSSFAQPIISGANVHLNILWLGVPNIIKIDGINDSIDVSLEFTSGEIKKLRNNLFDIRGRKLGDCEIKLINNRGYLVQTLKFVTKLIPSPYAIINANIKNTMGGLVELNDLLLVNKLTAPVVGFGLELEFLIKGFKVIIIHNCQTSEYQSKSNYLSLEMKKTISTLISRDILIFRNIIALAPDGTSRKLNDIVYIIK